MSKIFAHTKSVCPVCLRTIDADRCVGPDGNLYLEKTCPEHGKFSALIWEGDLRSYLLWGMEPERQDAPAAGNCPRDCGLCAGHLTGGCCVLLELTNRCNLRCPVCFAQAGEREPEDLSLEEISGQYDMLMRRGGPYNIQLSGGEPTMRDDLPEIIRLGRERGFSFFQLNSNGLRLADEAGYASKLREAGLSCVFLQFDGLDDRVYETLRGRPLLETKLRAIDSCAGAGLGVVLVPVVTPGVNEDAIGGILRFAEGRIPAVRGVHFQPLSRFGRCALPQNAGKITIPRILRDIEEQTGGVMKAEDFGGGGAENPYCSFHASYMRTPGGVLKALPRRRSECCCTKPSEARDFVSRQWSGPKTDAERAPCGDMEDTSSLDEFLRTAKENTFTVSGMVFQDAFDLDLDRLRRCYICEADTERGMVPFCAYNLTDTAGRALYRK